MAEYLPNLKKILPQLIKAEYDWLELFCLENGPNANRMRLEYNGLAAKAVEAFYQDTRDVNSRKILVENFGQPNTDGLLPMPAAFINLIPESERGEFGEIVRRECDAFFERLDAAWCEALQELTTSPQEGKQCA